MEFVSLERTLIDGALFTVAFTVLVMGSLIYNSRLWMHDFPKEIQALQAPLSRAEKRDQIIMGTALFVLLFGGLGLSALNLKTINGGALSFGAAFAHIYLIWSIVNLWDAVVIDLGLLVVKPSFMMLPGVASHWHALTDPKFHIVNFFKGVVGGVVLSAMIALVVIVL